MLGEGICAEDILTFMRCDDIAVLRVKDTNLIKSAVGKAYDVKRTGTEYDFDFEANNKRFYCTEFVDYCFGNIVGKTLAAEEKIMPDDFLNEKLFNIVWRKQKK